MNKKTYNRVSEKTITDVTTGEVMTIETEKIFTRQVDCDKFYKVFYDGKEIGTTISCENKIKCEQKKDQFMNFIKNSQYKIYNLAENMKKEDSLKLDSSIIDYMFSLDGMGMKKNGEPDSQNPTNFHQWENPNSIFYSDSELREKFLIPLFRLNK